MNQPKAFEGYKEPTGEALELLHSKLKSLKATFKTTVLNNGAVKYSVFVNGKIQSTYTGGEGYLRSQLEAYRAAVFECRRINGELSIAEDGDLGLITLAALRYALPRHTYIVKTVADFIRRHWDNPAIEKHHNNIRKDIEEFLNDHKESEEMFGGMDYREWQSLYNHINNSK